MKNLLLTTATALAITATAANASITSDAGFHFKVVTVEADPVPEALQLAFAGGWWTHCWVNLNNGVQIAVVNAKTVKACASAGKKCANGRPYSGINHRNATCAHERTSI